MTTSGTVASTVLDTATVIEHAFRRVRVHPAQQTPETVALARENLYMLLLNLANRGLNLWCVQDDLIGLTSGKSVYDSLPGTIDILNVVYCKPSRVTGTDSSTATSIVTELASATSVRRVGVMFSSVTASDTLTLSYSTDGVSYTDLLTETKTDWASDTWYWFELPTIVSDVFFKAAMGSAATFSEFYLASQVADLPVIQWNRDTWAVINNKAQSGGVSTNYYLERLLTPRITLWPVPNNSYDHLQLFVQRQVQDIGSLTQQIEVPQRWVESITWQLALRLAFELPQVDAQMIQLVSAMADKVMIEVEHEESDGAPIVLQPGISVYTR